MGEAGRRIGDVSNNACTFRTRCDQKNGSGEISVSCRITGILCVHLTTCPPSSPWASRRLSRFRLRVCAGQPHVLPAPVPFAPPLRGAHVLAPPLES